MIFLGCPLLTNLFFYLDIPNLVCASIYFFNCLYHLILYSKHFEVIILGGRGCMYTYGGFMLMCGKNQ